jgi:hypothetical protein
MGTLNSRPMPKHNGLYINSLEIHAGTWSSLLSRGKRDVMRTLIVAGKLVLPGSCPGRCRLRDTVRRIPIPTAGARRVPLPKCAAFGWMVGHSDNGHLFWASSGYHSREVAFGEMINPQFSRSHSCDGSPLAATQRDRPRREPARLAISAKDRNAALTAAAFGNSSATSGAMTTTLEPARSFSVYFPRTNAPKSERLYSERSSSAAAVLAFLIELPFRSRRKTRGNDPNYVVILDVRDHQQTPQR